MGHASVLSMPRRAPWAGSQGADRAPRTSGCWRLSTLCMDGRRVWGQPCMSWIWGVGTGGVSQVSVQLAVRWLVWKSNGFTKQPWLGGTQSRESWGQGRHDDFFGPPKVVVWICQQFLLWNLLMMLMALWIPHCVEICRPSLSRNRVPIKSSSHVLSYHKKYWGVSGVL